MYNRETKQKFHESYMKRKTYSVLCKCGHRVYINPGKEFAVCCFCGKKHISPKENFKNKLKNLLEEMGGNIK